MAVQTYEILFLVDPNKYSSDPDGVHKLVNGIVEHYGGQIAYTRPWGETKLAYPIKNFKKGSYILTYFKSEGKAIPQIEHDCELSDVVLRHLVLKLHPKIAEQVLAHLLGGGELPRTEPEPVEAGPGERRRREHRDHHDRDRPRDRDRGERSGRGDRDRDRSRESL